MDFKEIYCSSNMEEKMAKNETISIDINFKPQISGVFLFCYNVLKGRVVNFTCSREYPDLYCLYVDINPGIEKTNIPNRYQYHSAISAEG